MRADGREEACIFSEAVQLLLVLDLSKIELGPGIKSPGVFEPYWNQSIAAFLKSGGFVDGEPKSRSESRYLVGPRPTKAELVPLLSRLGDHIVAAAQVLRS